MHDRNKTEACSSNLSSVTEHVVKTEQVDICIYSQRWNLCLSFLFFIFLPDLSARVDAVKEENLKLKSENQVLGQYIENLMSASSVFQTTDTKSKRK